MPHAPCLPPQTSTPLPVGPGAAQRARADRALHQPVQRAHRARARGAGGARWNAFAPRILRRRKVQHRRAAVLR
eukprot:365010-Chlamydomonas_euryale.AAC.1